MLGLFKTNSGKRSLLCVGTVAALLSAGVLPAQAQFPYWYLYGAQSLLYPLTRGLTAPFMYGPYNSNPWYSTSSFLRRTAGRASAFPYGYNYNPTSYANWGYRSGGAPSYSPQQIQQPGGVVIDPATGRTIDADDEPIAVPGTTQSATPNFYLPGPDARTQSLYAPQPTQQVLPQGVMPTAQPVVGAQQPYESPTALRHAKEMPPKAPKAPRSSRKHKDDRNSNSTAGDNAAGALSGSAGSAAYGAGPGGALNPGSVSGAVGGANSSTSAVAGGNAGTTGNTGATGGVSSPLADGFVNHLVSKYDGHVGNAFNNADTRNWAKAMGLIDEDHKGENLSADRIEVLGRILKDSSLDSVSKVDAMRILLRQKSAQK